MAYKIHVSILAAVVKKGAWIIRIQHAHQHRNGNVIICAENTKNPVIIPK